LANPDFTTTPLPDLGIAHVPFRWNIDRNTAILSADKTREQSAKEGARDGN